MNKKQSVMAAGILVVLCCLFCSMCAGVLLARYFAASQKRILTEVTAGLVEAYPQEEKEIMLLVKKGLQPAAREAEKTADYLSAYGYRLSDFASGYLKRSIGAAFAGTAVVLLLLAGLYGHVQKKRQKRVGELTGYLEKINREGTASILPDAEDMLAPLQDEIYKTVTALRLAREAAVQERKNFADNLANIAHQLKTPVASLSIVAQLMETDGQGGERAVSLRKQTARLERLIEALLTLSRIDAGVLQLEKKEVDIFTLLELSAEGVDEIIRARKIRVDIPNHPDITFQGDMEWSMEAFSNLIKNCAEHTPEGGRIIMDYTCNPLYTQIMIQDTGAGFASEELPHVFERFYRGKDAGENGIGIGLSLAKSLIEMQNGFLTAQNLPEGGACFTVRFYHH